MFIGYRGREEGELDKGLPEIVELFDDNEKILKEAQKQKLELEALQAEELRLNSLETFGPTKARKGEESSRKNQKSDDRQMI